jgi:hypothetical protein
VEKGEKMHRNFIRGNNAVAGVIEALLIVALVSIIISTIQLVYVPQMMSEREADHMDEVENQFSFLKSIIDLQWMTKEDVPIVSPITLGNDALPYLVSAGAKGVLEVVDGSDYDINIDFGSVTIPLTAIKFTAYNYYYLDGADLIYTLEGGSIILNQTTGNPLTAGEQVIVDPAIEVGITSEIDIYYDIPIIVGVTGKKSYPFSSDIAYIRTNYSNSDSSYISVSNVNSIMITTEHPTAWYDLMQELLGDNVNYELTEDYIEITDKDDPINFYYKRIYIYAQIGPGWTK